MYECNLYHRAVTDLKLDSSVASMRARGAAGNCRSYRDQKSAIEARSALDSEFCSRCKAVKPCYSRESGNNSVLSPGSNPSFFGIQNGRILAK
jgi:hypothetical protein